MNFGNPGAGAPPPTGLGGSPQGGSYIDDIMGQDISGEETLGATSPESNPLASKWAILSPDQKSRIEQIVNEKPGAAPGAAPMGGAPALGAAPGISPIQPLKR